MAKNMSEILERTINVEYTITGPQIEKTVKPFGTAAHVTLPKRLIGIDVLVIIPEE